MSTRKAITALSVAMACLTLPGCHQHSSQVPTAQSVQNQSDEEREYEKFRQEVERKKHTKPANAGHESDTWKKQVP